MLQIEKVVILLNPALPCSNLAPIGKFQLLKTSHFCILFNLVGLLIDTPQLQLNALLHIAKQRRLRSGPLLCGLNSSFQQHSQSTEERATLDHYHNSHRLSLGHVCLISSLVRSPILFISTCFSR